MKYISFTYSHFLKNNPLYYSQYPKTIPLNFLKLSMKQMKSDYTKYKKSYNNTSNTNFEFKKLFLDKDYNTLFEKLCNRSNIQGKEEEIFGNYSKIVNELLKDGKASYICDFYGSIVNNENLIFRNKDYIFLIFEKSIPIFQNNFTLNALDIDQLIKVLQFFVIQKSYINNHFYFNLINTVSNKLLKNDPFCLNSIVNIIFLSKELRYFHFKLINLSVTRFLEMKQKPDAQQFLQLIEGLTFLNSKNHIRNIMMSPELYSNLLNMEDTMIKLQIISMLVLTNTINSEQTLNLLGNSNKLNLKKSKEVSYLKFIILIIKIHNKEFKEYDKLINFKFCHIEPLKLRNHYNVVNLDFFNFFKYYFQTHFLDVFKNFSVEFDYSVMDIFIIPIRLKCDNFNFFIELGAEDSYLKNYDKILNGFDSAKHMLIKKYFTDEKVKFKLILIENSLLYNKNLEEKFNTMDIFFKKHLY